MKRLVDHIVYAVHDLDRAKEEIAEKLGVRPITGGRHLNEGTKNAIVNLGYGCYLEIIAIDKENDDFQGAHWMGLDLLESDKITRWAIKTEDPKKDASIVREYNQAMGGIKGGSRLLAGGDVLEWDLVMPLAEPEVEVVPFMTDWSRSDVHPTDSLEEECALVGLEIIHPDPDSIRPILTNFMENKDLKKGNAHAIHIYINSPKGIIKL